MIWCRACQLVPVPASQERCETCMQQFCEAPTTIITVEQRWAQLRRDVEGMYLTDFFGQEATGELVHDNHAECMRMQYLCGVCGVRLSPLEVWRAGERYDRRMLCGHPVTLLREVLS